MSGPRDRGSQVGLCAHCRMAVVQPGARGARYWRCRRANSDPRFRRYPPLPVERCSGHDEGLPEHEGFR